MLIDTHCHINMLIKQNFDLLLTSDDLQKVEPIIRDAVQSDVTVIINVGTSLLESKNCILLAKNFRQIFATVGIHPNDLTENWNKDFLEIKKMVKKKAENRIVGIGECGLDFHYEGFNKQRQKDAFKAHIELALKNDLALVVHTRDAGDETLYILDEYKKNNARGVIHCFSENLQFAQNAIEMGFHLGIGGTVTYPKNTVVRSVVETISLNHIVLETDAPFLPPQEIRGKKKYTRADSCNCTLSCGTTGNFK